jgi:phage terminase small subunit
MPVLKNQKRETYCLERVKGRTQPEAYIIAGYQAKTQQVAEAAASRLERDPEVLNRIEELRAKVLPTLNKMLELKGEKAVLDRAWVLERLMRNARIAMGEETVKLTLRRPSSRKGGGEESNATETLEISDRDAQAANKALELLGKTNELRMWVDQVERGSAGDFSRMTDEELRAFLDEPIASPALENNGATKH